ncbi:Putative nicotinamide N-methyltransferase [Beauveria bassiana D1-5]|uniref:Protein N-terminal and lysine N-methyltransferase EFM7 n=1 Tax=Beauveria bassiana D1-5 TaxID=1245745 RepID=A0A0A2VPQ9_BEABA|nr:Putative nicotinamide N-methyltransferase [Beauveria bassiana D1-5]
MDNHDDSDDYGAAGFMEEPDDYYPPTPPLTQQVYTMKSGKDITLHLVGASPTEAHHLWNGAKVVSDYLEAQPSRVRGRTVLELGAASGLPSLVAGLLGASRVVMTDFPDPEIIANMQKNIDLCDETAEPRGSIANVVDAAGFVWGGDVAPLLARLGGDEGAERRFDVLILADLLFRHNEHGMLVKTIKEAMGTTADSVAYVFFTSYRPWKRDLDMKFFDVAREAGLEVVRVEERMLDKPLFENDPGDLDVQKTVNGFEVRWPRKA